jgi:SAM-dependent methyltransferase
MARSALLNDVRDYYSAKVREHGPTPRGVDWNSAQSQEVRFAQLLKVVDVNNPGVIGDYGCGYGGLLDYLSRGNIAAAYKGFDISAAMLAEARRRHDGHPSAVFTNEERDLAGADFILASGIFNVRLKTPAADWQAYVLDTIDRLAELSSRGFAFNCLTSYSDADRMRADLHYADPCELFDHCKRRYARNVALLHDYELYEFTILVRKNV